MAQIAADDADVAPKVAPVCFSEFAAQDAEATGSGHQIPGQGHEQGGFSRAIGSENNPVLSGLHAPSNVVEDDGPFSFHQQSVDLDQGWARMIGGGGVEG